MDKTLSEKLTDSGKIGYVQGVLKGIISSHLDKFPDQAHRDAIILARQLADELGDSIIKYILK